MRGDAAPCLTPVSTAPWKRSRGPLVSSWRRRRRRRAQTRTSKAAVHSPWTEHLEVGARDSRRPTGRCTDRPMHPSWQPKGHGDPTGLYQLRQLRWDTASFEVNGRQVIER
ncbi:hypothetical protein NDU88_005904 [Pleurodeles waltl]|uniref:Uncharacterized protein n=1 Tax=Pleurodeles waltl TaxID=8319 RepID=A0AAV7TCR2_PLEWA|nr:hypothetical protein NDU88_005904 [Pleurodeles waltl]